MDHIIELSPELKGIFKELSIDEEDMAVKAITAGLRELLKECEEEILEFEIKYGLPFEKFNEEFEKGRLGDPHSYPLEKDAMTWDDLVKEKQVRLKSLRKLEQLNA